MQTALTSPRCLKTIVGYTICHLLAIFILSSHHQAFFALDSFLGISVISSVWVKFLVVTITLFHFSFYKWGYWSLGRWPFWSLILSCRGKKQDSFYPITLDFFSIHFFSKQICQGSSARIYVWSWQTVLRNNAKSFFQVLQKGPRDLRQGQLWLSFYFSWETFSNSSSVFLGTSCPVCLSMCVEYNWACCSLTIVCLLFIARK